MRSLECNSTDNPSNEFTTNTTKTGLIMFTRNTRWGNQVRQITKYLGVYIDFKLTMVNGSTIPRNNVRNSAGWSGAVGP